jgi:drug/metabolite transporter (DMT)-like permease
VKHKIKRFLPLQMAFFLYSISVICAKLAAKEEFLSIRFILFYFLSLLILLIYSVLWQRILRKLPLTTAFSNKGVVVIWGMIWGTVFFGESLNAAKVAAALLIVSGIVVLGKANG